MQKSKIIIVTVTLGILVFLQGKSFAGTHPQVIKLLHHTNPYQSYPDNVLDKTIKLINKSQENILVVIQELDNPVIINSLIKARNRGVQVGIITNSSSLDNPGIGLLKNTGTIILINNGMRDINFYVIDGFDVIVDNTWLKNATIASVYTNEFVRIYQNSEKL